MTGAPTWKPLSGVRVVEYGDGVAAAFCAKLLADLGAEVTKLIATVPRQHTEEGELRARAQSLYLDGAKTIVRGVTAAAATSGPWVRDVDVVVRGLEPADGSAFLLRGEYDRWTSVSGPVVFLALTPFGASGPGQGWRGGDLCAQVLSGWTYATGEPDKAPLAMNYGMAPIQHGTTAAGAVLTALLARGSSGRGEFVDVSEADVIAATMRMYSFTYRFLEIELRRQGMRAPGNSGRYPHAIFPCKDGYVSFICRAQTDWDRFVEMIGSPEWTGDPRYRDYRAMGIDYPDEVDALIVPFFMRYTKDELGALATRHRVPLAPLRTVDEVLADPQLAHRSFFVSRRVDGRAVDLPGIPARTSAADPSSQT